MEFPDLASFENAAEEISGELIEYEKSYGDRITAVIQLTDKIEHPHFPEHGMPQITPYTAFVMKQIFFESSRKDP